MRFFKIVLLCLLIVLSLTIVSCNSSCNDTQSVDTLSESYYLIPEEPSSALSSSDTSTTDDMHSDDSKIKIAYTEETICKSYYLVPEEPAATFNASYPVFKDSIYEDFNEEIVDHEVSVWMKIYDEMCAQADEDIEADPMLATFNRHLEVKYSVDVVGEEIKVKFYAEWMWTLSNYEPKYWRTYTFSDGMIYATTVTCERIY